MHSISHAPLVITPAALGQSVCFVTRTAEDGGVEVFANTDQHLHTPEQICAATEWLAA